MRVYLLPESFNGESFLVLKGKDYNYIVNSLRLKEGQLFTGRDRCGNPWNLKIVSIKKEICIIAAEAAEVAIEQTDNLPEDRPTKNIILYQCLPKGRKADDIIKKATEIGARAIVIVKSKNCVADLSGKENSRVDRYNSVVREAIQQSGSMVPTVVDGVIDIKDVPFDFEKRCNELGQEGRGLFLHQCKIRENQSNLVSSVIGFDGTVGVLIGSEGGLTDEECSFLIKCGFRAVLLKSNILRCETASVYALSAIQTIIESSFNTTC